MPILPTRAPATTDARQQGHPGIRVPLPLCAPRDPALICPRALRRQRHQCSISPKVATPVGNREAMLVNMPNLGGLAAWTRITLATVVLLPWAGAAGPAGADDAALLRIGVQNERPPFSFADDEGELKGSTSKSRGRFAPRRRASASSFRSSSPRCCRRWRRGDRCRSSVDVDHRGAAAKGRLYRQVLPGIESLRGAPGRCVRHHAVWPRGKTIGVKRGTIHDRYLSDHFAATAAIRRYGYSDEIFIDLALAGSTSRSPITSLSPRVS